MGLETELMSKLMDDISNNRLTLPTLPEIAIKVRDMVEDPNSSAAKIAVTVGSDPVLSTKLLQIANSAAYNSGKQVQDVQTAVARLGAVVIRNVVSGIVMAQLYQPSKDGKTAERLKNLWLHSTRVAAISHVLARKFTKLKADQAMLGGLIHDIGAIPVYNEIASIPELDDDDDAAKRIVQKLHNLIGTAILDEWNFPQELIDVVANHEDFNRDSGGNVDYVDVVTVANLHSYIGTSHPLTKLDWSEIPAFKKLGLTPEESIAAMEEASEEVAMMQKMFS